ncbi:Zinc finger, C2H2 [Cordyceps fumosorosea ARSEF 2679]|uniref:Zinc finger, C2H2 n=1 Tax=Cordyceps fumosorosea (strain ARSEF 2679) TaxID=1081104 RepID=A0A167SXH7_CORFA|nr:Zinc finger, C2H2 [Cordyceps fumosorosea ARSEF 2679]OAA60031.1 Zinc finger, C2H2 [Cordyceps fumosorosea ARSEF 2679]
MSHIAPRPPQPPPAAHLRARSDPPAAPEKRLELVGKLEGCIHDVLEATKAFKAPQPQSAHQNANQMFQQRVMASQARSGDMSNQDWVGTMMQCLNESMKTQQSSFVRNTTLDVALKAFASGVFETLGLTYFREPFDKYVAASRQKMAVNTAVPHHGPANFGIPSPPREIGPGPGLMQQPGPQGLLRAPAQPPTFPSAHHQLAQSPLHVARPTVMTLPQEQLHGMPIFQSTIPSPLTPAPVPAAVSALAPPPKSRLGRPPKRPSPSAVSSPTARKRAYTSEALRQAAGPMGPPPPPPPPPAAQARSSAPPRPRLCIDVWNVQQERDPRRRQAILGYGGKWYVFQCHQHEEVLFFKTADGARHHMLTRHALPHQHVDFLDIVRELGVEVMHCDAARAEKNNLDAVNLWNFAASSSASPVESPLAQQATVLRRDVVVPVQEPVRAPPVSTLPRSASRASPAVQPEPALLPQTQRDSPSIVLLSDDEEEDQPAVTIKREREEKESISFPAKVEQETRITPVPAEASELAGRAIEALKASRAPSVPPLHERDELPTQPLRTSQSPEKLQTVEPPAKDSTIPAASETVTERAVVTRDAPESIPDLEPDSPQSSELSEAPSLQDLDSFAPGPAQADAPEVADDELEEGEITESTIEVVPWAPVREDTTASPDSGKKKKKRRISGAISSSGTQRKKLPWTPKSSQKKAGRQSFWSPSQEGPSAHDQFKTRACKKCSERFYFRAQLATHMKTEHPEVVQ